MKRTKATYSPQAYERLISELFDRHQSFQTAGSAAYKSGLDRVLEYDRRHGFPHRRYPCVHIAGTNGKGSTAHFLAAILSSGGLRVGLYTSPHIIDFTERLRIVSDQACSMVSKEWVFDYISCHIDEFDKAGFSFFEITTMMAFEWFAAEKVDIAVIETGLGGRLDTTNIISPVLSIITSIGLDHTDILGDSLEAIAMEKAGIIKPGVPVVVGENLRGTLDVFKEVAADMGSPLFEAPKAHAYDIPQTDFFPEINDELIARMDLGGKYQRMNLATVKKALEVLISQGIINPPFRERCLDAIVNCAQRTAFKGRWQILGRKPLVIADMGHNGPALEENFAQLSQISQGQKLIIIYAKARDKALEPIVKLFPRNARFIFTQAKGARALAAEELKSQVLTVSDEECFQEAIVAPDPTQALQLAREEHPDIIYIGGTSFILGEVTQ